MQKQGRPKVDTEQVTLRLHVGVIAALDDLRANATDKPSRPEIIRRIISAHLDDLRKTKT